MRILPRSAKGTWLLTVAAWAAGCAIVWQMIPPAPRAVVNFPGDKSFIGIGPGGRTVTFMAGRPDMGGGGPVIVWDTVVGKVRTVGEKKVEGQFVLSPDGRWLAAGVGPVDFSGGPHRVRIVDLTTGAEDELGSEADALKEYSLAGFSPDNKWLAIAENDPKSGAGIRLWNLVERKPGVYLPNAWPNVVFSADGKRLATGFLTGPASLPTAIEFAVLDPSSGRVAARFSAAPGFDWIVAAITADGAGLIGAEYNARLYGRATSQIRRWNTSDGSLQWAVKDGQAIMAVDGGQRFVVLLDREGTLGATSIATINTADGQTIATVPLDPETRLESVSPDGRTVLVTAKQFSLASTVRDWLARWGLPVSPTWPDSQLVLLDATTGRRLLSLPACVSMFASDGKSFVHFTPESDRIELWDIPPPKPLSWFALAAVGLALPLAGLALRRSRRLRQEVA